MASAWLVWYTTCANFGVAVMVLVLLCPRRASPSVPSGRAPARLRARIARERSARVGHRATPCAHRTADRPPDGATIYYSLIRRHPLGVPAVATGHDARERPGHEGASSQRVRARSEGYVPEPWFKVVSRISVKSSRE